MLHARICGGYCDCGRFVENFIYRKRPRFSGECFKRGRLGPKCLFTRSASEAVYDNVAGESRTVTPASFADIKQTEEQVNDEFGAGTSYTFTFTRPDNGDDVQMVQRFCVYEENDFLITDLSIEGTFIETSRGICEIPY